MFCSKFQACLEKWEQKSNYPPTEKDFPQNTQNRYVFLYSEKAKFPSRGNFFSPKPPGKEQWRYPPAWKFEGIKSYKREGKGGKREIFRVGGDPQKVHFDRKMKFLSLFHSKLGEGQGVKTFFGPNAPLTPVPRSAATGKELPQFDFSSRHVYIPQVR